MKQAETAAKNLLSGKWQAVVTGPVSKKALHDVGCHFPGQTEFFAARAGVENFAMCLTGGGLTVIANAPNPAGQTILARFFPEGISPLGLLLGALVPTVIVGAALVLL